MARTLRCVSRTPFGSAVAPEVKITSASSSGPPRSARTSAAPAAARPAPVRPAAMRRRNGQTATPCGSRGARWSSPTSTARASTMAATRATSRPEARKSTGTSTARASRPPHSAAIQSGQFSPQTITLSPGPTPAPASRREKATAAARTSSYV